MKKPVDLNAAYQPEHFAFRDGAKVAEIISRYPKGKQRSATMPLLDLAQRQVGEDGAAAKPPYGGWIPRAAMDEIARLLDIPAVKVYEVATFYSMYNLAPVGKYLVQMCTTTPCMLCGSANVVKACEDHLGVHTGETTADGMFTLMEVECLGACVNAPMVQIGKDYYEDLTADKLRWILDELAAGRVPTPGPQNGRFTSEPKSGLSSLTEGERSEKANGSVARALALGDTVK
ncbi:MAG TPA: NADH-quinone oxidoreductase subunit NuoE, partial [Alphaproteobacteria bacterium]|nr:NADH-quinone oxidoreductase subunit NuoE [Alphaproteobacteria bacterium]